jgi:hypothetical protein
MNNMSENYFGGEKVTWSDNEIQQLTALTSELYAINEELNARCIAFHAKLTNEEAKVRQLSAMIQQMQAQSIQNFEIVQGKLN